MRKDVLFLLRISSYLHKSIRGIVCIKTTRNNYSIMKKLDILRSLHESTKPLHN